MNVLDIEPDPVEQFRIPILRWAYSYRVPRGADVYKGSLDGLYACLNEVMDLPVSEDPNVFLKVLKAAQGGLKRHGFILSFPSANTVYICRSMEPTGSMPKPFSGDAQALYGLRTRPAGRIVKTTNDVKAFG